MISLVGMTALLLLSGPEPSARGEGGPGGTEAPALRVEGRVALDPWTARENAEQAALRRVQRELERRADRLLEASEAGWLPAVLEDRARDRWLAGVLDLGLLEISDESTFRREHGGYESFQVRLEVRPDAEATEAALDRYRRELSQVRRRTVGLGVATLALWGLLGLGFVWFDRLTRGYMPYRLGAVALGIGAAAPGLGFCMI